ncbi:dihydrofolate reductase [Candidatus Falkowbacteria bacterium]|nr:dihydrofolate reductase [Candidatus Falkowbacteria bacterium]
MIISAIAVTNKNRAIGFKNKLLWNLPPDLEHFKKITAGHTVIMGGNTFVSLGRPLPNRVNIVITKNKDFLAPGCIVVFSPEEALVRAKAEEEKLENEHKEIFIIGGASIYAQMLAVVNKLYLTIVDDTTVEADTFFPDYSEFKKIISESEPQEYNGLKYKFIELTR